MFGVGGALLRIVLIFGWNSPGDCHCPSDWDYYEPEQTCLQPYYAGLTWKKGRDICKEKGADHIVVMRKDKFNFIKDHFLTRWYWLGANDLDSDGTFTYTNGSIVKSREPGVGDLQYKHWAKGDHCIDVSGYSRLFDYTKCNDKRFSICEKYLNPLVHSDSTTCSLDNCPCKRDMWKLHKPGLKYVKPNHYLANYTTSVKICEKLGGQLLTVLDQDTHSFVKGLSSSWSPRGVPYWTGLRAINKTHWAWTIENTKHPLTFGTWFADFWLMRKCAVVVWNYYGLLRAWNCMYQQYQVCETKDPCSARPILTVDGVQVKSENNIYVAKSDLTQSVGIKCSAKGYIPSVSTTTFICFGMTERKTGTLEVDESIVVDETWHGKRCTCRVILNDGKNKQESFRINYQIPPRLKSKTETAHYEIQIGDDLHANIEIIANPEPKLISVIGVDSNDALEGFDFNISPGEGPFQYVLTLSVWDFQEADEGNYTLKMENGLQESMAFHIFLQARDPKQKEEDSQFSIAILVMVGVLWASMMVFLMSGGEESGYQEEASDSIKVEQTSRSIPEDDNAHDYTASDESDEGSVGTTL